MKINYLTVEEIAILTGLSRQFFYGEVYKAKVFGYGIPYFKFGPRIIRFDAEAVSNWLETRHQDFRSLKDAVEKRRSEGSLNLELSERIKNRPKKEKAN